MQATEYYRDAVLKAARAYYAAPGNEAGGSLHIVLDDGNIEDVNVEWCLNEAQTRGDIHGATVAQALLGLSVEDRQYVFESL